MELKNDTLILITIRFIAILCGLIGLFYLILNFRQHLFMFTNMFFNKYPGVSLQIWYVLISICTFLILILRPIASYGLLTFKKWGRNLTIGILSVDFIIRLLVILNVTTYSLRYPEISQKLAEMQASGDLVIVQTSSILPTYNIALLSLFSVIFLLATRKWKH